MPLTLRIESELDERSAAAAASRAQRIYSDAARDMSRDMSEGITRGAREGGRAVERMADEARSAYKRVGDATDDLREQERQLKAMRDEGARGVEVQAERVRRARKAEKDAIREATDALEQYERAARGASQAGEQAGGSIVSGLRGASAGVRQSGQGMAEDFVGGFAGSSALLRIGAAGGPVGIAIAGLGALGFAGGKALADQISAGLATLQTQDLFQARMGLDPQTMARYGENAANAYVNAVGNSMPDNLQTIQFAVQGGVLDPRATDEQIKATLAQINTLTQVGGVGAQEAARATGQLMRSGLAQDSTQAADIIASGFQNGLDISGDWLDTITEYSTQFRKLGLDGSDALGLIKQGLDGAARDTDVVADSLKEFSIRAVDGSKQTAEGFASLGFNADDMARRILAGGDSARSAFGATLQAIRSIDDPIQQALTWQALFGTQWEDMGDAINKMDLSTARTQFADTEGAIDRATQTLSAHVNEWDVLNRSIDQTFSNLQTKLANSQLGQFFGSALPRTLNNLLTGEQIGPGSGNIGPATAPGWTPETGAPMPPGAPLTIDTPAGVSPLLDQARAALGLAPGQMPGALPTGAAPTAGAGAAGGPPAAPPPPPPGPPGPTPGPRTPMLTDLQQEAAGGGSSRASLPDAPVLPMTYSSTAGLPASLASATTRLDEARHEVAEKEARVNQLQQSNVATADEIQKAKNDLAKAEQDRLQADRALNDAKINATEKQTKQLQGTTDSLKDLGAGLDSDFGISKGLAGIADNIVRFVGSLALAGPMAQLSAISAANPNQGSGLMGMLASSGALGSQYLPAASTGGAVLPGAGNYVGSSGNPNLDAMFALAQGSSGRTEYGPASDLINGLADCSGSISDLYEVLTTGAASPARMFTTTNFASDAEAAKLGFRPGYMPGALNVGVNPYPGQSGHMAATLPNGVNFEGGGGTGGGAQYGGSASGALDPQFEKQYYFPVGSGPASMSYATPGLYSPANTSPGLNNPAAAGTSPAGLPPVGSVSGGESAPLGLTGQSYPSQGGGGGGIGISEGAMGALSTAASVFPGGGALASMGMQLANRTIKYAGQVAGIGVEGLAQTFLPSGDKPKASIGNSWLGKIAGGIAGAKPAVPNAAGGKSAQPPGPMDQAGGAQASGQAGARGDTTITLNQTNNHPTTGDMAANSAVREMGAVYAPPGRV
ncbi:phage tail tape measure protein [Mycobacterium sp. C3-094]